MLYILAVIHLGLWGVLLGNVRYLWQQRREHTPAAYPRISVLIPARNEEENLQRLLPSLLAQDYPDFEIIVYDDGSEDGTWRVLEAHADPRLKTLRGDGPPQGWVGKVHALYQATRHATGERFLFLDADAELLGPGALRRLAGRFEALPDDSVMTGLVDLRGGGKPLVSLVPNAILAGLPWPLVREHRMRGLGALNGQFWMIRAEHYRRHEPHAAHQDEVLEDVMIGRYLRMQGLVPVLADVRGEVAVYMYRSLAEAWRGFRKNAYLIMGGTPVIFVLWFILFAATYVAAPFVWPGFLVSIYLSKLITDRLAGYPLWISLLAPLSFLLGVFQQLDSAIAHWTGRVAWKGRRVAQG